MMLLPRQKTEAITKKVVMKFGKKLQNRIFTTAPQWAEEFISYKDLKRQLKLFDPNGDEDGFGQLLVNELEKIETFLTIKEEEHIILLKELKDEVANLGYGDDATRLTSDLLRFHSEMVLLLHYNTLNLEGVLKIMKKHMKKTGNPLTTSPSLLRDMQQRVFTTDLLYRLLAECEAQLRQLL